MQQIKKVLLIILDGFGIRKNNENNAQAQASMPNWDYYTANYAFGQIEASGNEVGLPSGQFGNSEVGHLNIGAGRVVRQEISRIDYAIETGEFFTNSILLNMLNASKTGVVHIMGLLSDGGVHSHINHIFALIKLAQSRENIKHVFIHAFLDGRDTPPKSSEKYLMELNNVIVQNPKAQIATIIGRFYAMDRDKRYERLESAYNAIVLAQSAYIAPDALTGLQNAYTRNENDEFVKSTIISDYHGCHDGDSVIFANFRADRAIQLSEAFVAQEYTHFLRHKVNLASFVSMTHYSNALGIEPAFCPVSIKNTLGECIAKQGLKQLRIAETEKYPHVTYFFNGGEEAVNDGEDRILIPSPKEVATYDLKPEMSLPEVCDKLVNAIKSEKYSLIVTNFANGDMVGHTGNLFAAIKAVEALDNAIGRSVREMLDTGGEVLIIADHGNCEEMYDNKIHQAHTQHTTNPVPFLYIGRRSSIISGGALKDVAPTLLKIMGLTQPTEMTGHSLIKF